MIKIETGKFEGGKGWFFALEGVKDGKTVKVGGDHEFRTKKEAKAGAEYMVANMTHDPLYGWVLLA